MKKVLNIIIYTLLAFTLIGCKTNNETNKIVVGVAFEPVKTIFELIKADIEALGYELEIIELGLTANNLALKDYELDANLIQHQYYLNNFNNANNSDLMIAFNLYHAIYSLYSSEITSIEELKDNTLITIPDDDANKSRAFYLLDQAGLITLSDKTKANLSENDIILNPKNLKFEYIALESIAQRYKETKYAIMYPTYARALNLEGNQDRIYVEKTDEITLNYAISLAIRPNDLNSEKIQTLITILQSDKVRNYLIENYSWASTPAF